MKHIIILSIALIGSLTFSACKKEDKGKDTPATTGNVNIEFEHNWDENTSFELNTNLSHTSLNQIYNFTTLKYYVSNIEFKDANGTWWKAPDSYYLVDVSNSGSSVLSVPNVPFGNYVELKYLIGVDSARNVSGAQTGALATSNSMFWSWNSGYIFWKAEGSCDKSSTGNFTYHIGGFTGSNNALRTVNIPFGSMIMTTTAASTPQIHLGVTVSHIVGTVNPATNNKVTMPNAIAASLANQFATAFELEHIHN